jgi:hypothetical protein
VLTSLPLWVKVLLAAGLVVSIGLAFFGRGPTQPTSRKLVLAVAAGGLAGYLVGIHAAVTGHYAFAAALIAAAVETMCLAVWLAKARTDGGDGGAGRDDDPDPAIPGDDGPKPDWDEFDRARGLWARRDPRERQRDREPV